MRLIDADACVEYMQNLIHDISEVDKPTTLDFNIGLLYAIQTIKAQPTVFDKATCDVEKKWDERGEF